MTAPAQVKRRATVYLTRSELPATVANCMQQVSYPAGKIPGGEQLSATGAGNPPDGQKLSRTGRLLRIAVNPRKVNDFHHSGNKP